MRSDEHHERFAKAVELPLGAVAVLWLPLIVVPLVAHLPAGMAAGFKAIDYLVWALFVVEYLVKLRLTPSRRQFFTHHVLDLVVVAVPVLRPLRALRLCAPCGLPASAASSRTA
ncbi:MAG: hypothetical protein ACP5VR_11445 [Acidimicrobiales bacterium]